jgi:hypothetical protein
MELRYSSESLSDRASNAIGYAAPLLPSGVSAWAPGSSLGRTPAPAISKNGSPLMSFRAPSESSTHRAAATSSSDRSRRRRCRHLPWGLVPFSVSPPGAAAYSNRASHGPIACASRFSQPPGAFVRPEPAGLVSCQIRSWGLALQSFAPPVQPFAVSGAVALLSLDHPSLLSEAARIVASAEAPRRLKTPHVERAS